jgi:hypothetical protein
MLRAIDDLDRRQSKTAADVIEQAAYFVIPAALTDAHIKQLRPGRKITSAFCAAW